MKPFLLRLIPVTISVKRFFLIPIFLLAFFSVNGQNGIIGTGFGTNDWSTTNDFLSGAGNSRIFTATPNGTGNQFFRLVRNWSSNYNQFGPFNCIDTDWTNPEVVYGMSDCGSGAFYINCPNTTDNYVFKTPNGDVSKDLLYFRVQGTIRSVISVTQLPLASEANNCGDRTVTATLDGVLATGQAVYVRYTKDGYATSTVVKLSGSGATYTGTIPSAFNTAGANVSYYVFTSGDSNVALNGSNADLYTINLNNNGGSNYSYVVSGAITLIPDPKFEQVLINLNLDCVIDGKVFTNNISSVTSLDLRDKNITSLVGIKDFTNLKTLYCSNLVVGDGNDNAITDLDVSGMTQLKYLTCENSNISNLNISGLTNLLELVISNNPLSTPILDLHESPNLYYLFCEYNGLTNINISGLINLKVIGMMGNSITTLDLSNNPNITYLDCDDNLFTSLDVSALINLNQFYCNSNSLTSLDVRGLTNLASFQCTLNSPSLTCILVDDVASATLKTTTVDPDPEAGGAFFWIKDATATYSYCKCDLTTTWNGSSWDNGAPTTGTYAAIIAADYSQSADINACSLTVTSNAIVSIPSGFNVTLNAPIIVTAGSSFTLSNNANLIQTNKKSINSGNINVNRDSSPLFRLDYTMWSSPVTGTQTLGNFSPLTDTSRFYEYNSTSNLYNAVASTGTFSSAKGYLIRMPNTWVDYVVSPPSTPLSWTGTFTGIPNNGDFSYALSNGTYIAVGNPYPSTLNVNQFITGNNGLINGTMWFWRKTNDATNSISYSTCTTAGCTSPNTTPYPDENFISVGQGFIVKATASGNLKFTNTMRVANNTNQFFKTKAVEKNRIWLNLSKDASPVNQMLLAYMTGATQGIDQAIDGAYFNDSQTALNSLIGSEEFAIQGRSLPFDGTDVVPLAFKTLTAGNFTIAIDHFDGLFSGSQDIILKDNTTGAETDLKAGSYVFAANAGVDNARFLLKYQKTLKVDAPVFNENNVTVYKNKGTLYVNSGSVAIANIKVFDVQGRLIAERNNVKANTTTISNLKSTQQVLIIKVTGQDNSVVSKKVVN